jgi:YD repeat-containing protein
VRSQYDGLEVVAEYDGAPSPGLQASYVFGPGLDEVLKLERGTTVAAYHSDGLGSVTAITVGGTARNTYRYDAFGQLVAQGGNTPLPNPYTYTGRERDGSGLYYYRALPCGLPSPEKGSSFGRLNLSWAESNGARFGRSSHSSGIW